MTLDEHYLIPPISILDVKQRDGREREIVVNLGMKAWEKMSSWFVTD